jgi:transposase
MSTCPKCGDSVSFVKGVYVEIKTPRQNLAGLSCLCPNCDAILSVSIDLIALTEDIAQGVVNLLRRRSDDGS